MSDNMVSRNRLRPFDAAPVSGTVDSFCLRCPFTTGEDTVNAAGSEGVASPGWLGGEWQSLAGQKE